MPLVTLDEIQIQFGPDLIFDRLRARFYPKEKVGLVGSNGCGKTTLLKMILGEVEPDVGSVRRRKILKAGYLPQEPQFSNDKTVIEELHSGADKILELQNKIHELSDSMSGLEGDELNAAMKRYDNLCHEFEAAGGYRYENKIKEIAAGLGLGEKLLNVKTNQLSGGQKSRLGLAKVLLTDANMLLLDEPTNHLDWNATLWLEQYLKNFKGSVVMVSHDRFLLDRLVDKIVEIRNRQAFIYPGNYSNYRKEKEKRDLEFQRQYQQRVEFVEKTRDFIARNKDQEGMRGTARGRKKRLDALLKSDPNYLEKPETEKDFHFEFEPVDQKTKRSQLVLGCKKLSKKYEDIVLFEGLDLEVLTGHRLGVIGPNGTGKTTFLKLAMGQIKPSSGEVVLKSNLSVGYLDQAQEQLNDNNTVLEEAIMVLPEIPQEKMRTRLGAFLFRGDDVFKRVSNLSGGERNRLALCKLVLAGPEVLILDEPTNHLDITSIESLERALRNYAGTIIVVSHDRFFLERTVDQLLVVGVDELGNKKLGRYEKVTGSFNRYSQLLDERRTSLENKSQKAKRKNKKAQKKIKSTPSELVQFAMWGPEKMEAAIEKTEAEIEAIMGSFGDESIYKDPEKYTEVQGQLDARKAYLDLLFKAYEYKFFD